MNVFQGSLNREQFFVIFLKTFLAEILFLALIADLAIFTPNLPTSIIPLINYAALILILPYAVISIKRFRDAGRSGWWALLLLIPIVGIFVLIYLFFAKGKDIPNTQTPLSSTSSTPIATPVSVFNAKFCTLFTLGPCVIMFLYILFSLLLHPDMLTYNNQGKQIFNMYSESQKLLLNVYFYYFIGYILANVGLSFYVFIKTSFNTKKITSQDRNLLKMLPLFLATGIIINSFLLDLAIRIFNIIRP